MILTLKGQRGSGKTTALAALLVDYAVNNASKKVLVVGQSYEKLTPLMELFLKRLEKFTVPIHINRENRNIWLDNETMVYFKAGGGPKGIDLDALFIDDRNSMKLELFQGLIPCVKDGGMIVEVITEAMPCDFPDYTLVEGACPDCSHLISSHKYPTKICSVC